MNIAETPTKFLSTDLLARFAAIVGDKNAITDPQAQAPYLVEMRDMFPGHTPMVLRPGSVAEVAAIVKLANETATAIVPQGGNTGLAGGQTPQHGELVLSLNRLDRIREVDPVSNTITCEAGVTLLRAREAAAEVDRLYPQLLPSEGTCTIGGNLSTNAGGTAALAYGIARSHVLGIEVVLADGRVLDNLNKLKKDNTGYDLKNLFIGAEGTLGVITAAVLRLVPRPRSMETAYAGVASAEAALELLMLAQDRMSGGVTSFEIMTRAGIAEANAAVTALIPGARPLPFGHLGDGNIHYNVNQPEGADKAVFLARWDEVNAVVFDVVKKYGGSISAEHGIGIMKRDVLPRVKDPVALDLMRTLKRTLDPKGILNPGKVL